MRPLRPLISIACLSLFARGGELAGAADRDALASALTLHASFDHGLEADFARGDARMYSFSAPEERARGGVPGVATDAIRITTGSGRFGDALLFARKVPVRPCFRDGGNIGYDPTGWSGTVSVWLRISPDIDLEPGYSDPIQIVGDDLNRGFVFLEFDKDSNPRYFRYVIRPLIDIWDPQRVGWAKLPFEARPMVQVERAPFSRARWTHVVFTFEHVNAADHRPSGKLYIDRQLQGTIEGWDLRFGWKPEAALLVLGSNYVGHLDELAVFDRVLTSEEISTLHSLPKGARELHQRARP